MPVAGTSSFNGDVDDQASSEDDFSDERLREVRKSSTFSDFGQRAVGLPTSVECCLSVYFASTFVCFLFMLNIPGTENMYLRNGCAQSYILSY